MMKIKVFASIAFAAICLYACDDNTETLGNSLTNKVDKFEIITDTFNVSTRSITVDSILSRGRYCYLGHIKDPETKAYITSNYTTQFAILEALDGTTLFPEKDSIYSKNSSNDIIADSCKLQIYFYSSIGDSLNPMRLTAYEMAHPIEEGNLSASYTNFDPEKNGLLRNSINAIKKEKVYTTIDLNMRDSSRAEIINKTNMEVVTIPLNNKYYDNDGIEYDNYGTYILRKYYSNPEYFKNSYNFIHNVCPGFYIKSTDGLGVMSEVYMTELAIFYRYKNDSIYNGSLLLSGTEEVLQTTNISNDVKTIAELAKDSTCTYIKTPAGIFTEVTLPVDDIKYGHEKDTISSAKIVFNRMNSTTKYAFGEPENIMMIQKDSLFSFFEKKNLPDYTTSFLGVYSGSNNTYTFNNISTLISKMYEAKKNGTASKDWNKVVLVPVSITYNTSSSSSSITNISNDMSLKSTRLVGGYRNQRQPITISIIYNRFIKE